MLEKTPDPDNLYPPPEEEKRKDVKRRLNKKTKDVRGDFKPPEEPPKEDVKRRLTTKTPDPNYKKTGTPVINVVPVVSAKPSTPAAPAKEEFDISEDPDLNERRVSVWLKYNVGQLEKALQKLNIPKEIEVNVKGELVKKRIDKLSKLTMVGMIRKKLNF